MRGCDRNSSISRLVVFFITFSRTDFALEGHSGYHQQTNLRLECTFQTARLPDFQVSCKNFKYICIDVQYGLGGASDEDPPANAGDIRDVGSTPGLRRSPGGGNGNPLQYSCLENPMDRGAWLTAVHGVKKSWT